MGRDGTNGTTGRSEEHTSELQSRPHLVCRLLLEKKKKLKFFRKEAVDLWLSWWSYWSGWRRMDRCGVRRIKVIPVYLVAATAGGGERTVSSIRAGTQRRTQLQITAIVNHLHFP